MRISDWSSDVCSSDLLAQHAGHTMPAQAPAADPHADHGIGTPSAPTMQSDPSQPAAPAAPTDPHAGHGMGTMPPASPAPPPDPHAGHDMGRAAGVAPTPPQAPPPPEAFPGPRHAADVLSDPSTRSEARERLRAVRSEEHTSELQSLMRISYAVFCLKKKKKK